VIIQSTRLYDSKLCTFVSLSNAGSPKVRVWLYSYWTDSRKLTLPLTSGPPNVNRGVHDSMPLNSPARRRAEGSRSFTVMCHASPARWVSTVRHRAGRQAELRSETRRLGPGPRSPRRSATRIASSPVTGSVPSALFEHQRALIAAGAADIEQSVRPRTTAGNERERVLKPFAWRSAPFASCSP